MDATCRMSTRHAHSMPVVRKMGSTGALDYILYCYQPSVTRHQCPRCQVQLEHVMDEHSPGRCVELWLTRPTGSSGHAGSKMVFVWKASSLAHS